MKFFKLLFIPISCFAWFSKGCDTKEEKKQEPPVTINSSEKQESSKPESSSSDDDWSYWGG